MIHRSTSGSPLPQHCETHQEQTGRQPAVEAATDNTHRVKQKTRYLREFELVLKKSDDRI